MMRLRMGGFAAVLLLLCSTQAARAAASIQYSIVPLGGNLYKFIYSVSNSGPSAVKLFDIVYDPALYDETSIAIVTPPPLSTQWDQQPLYSVTPVLKLAFTALGLFGGVPPGGTVSGFAVQIRYLGSGTPGAQTFEIYEAPPSFALLQTGTVVLGAVGVPTVSTFSLALLGAGLAVASAFQMRRRTMEAHAGRPSAPTR